MVLDGTISRRHRFTVLPEPLVRDKRVSDRAVRLWCLLDRYAGANGEAFPKRTTLADDLACSLPTLDRALDELVRFGWLHKARRYEGGVNDYTLLEGVLTGDETPVLTDDEGVSSPVRTPVVTGEETEKEASPTGTEETETEPVESIEDEFNRWYAEYPRKTGRGAALLAYKGARSKKIHDRVPTAEDLFNGLMAQLGTLLSKDVKYRPHPATWLNQQRWLDDYEPPETGTDGMPRLPSTDPDAARRMAAWNGQQ